MIDISSYKQRNNFSLKTFDNSFLMQDRDKLIFNKKELKFVSKNKPTKK